VQRAGLVTGTVCAPSDLHVNAALAPLEDLVVDEVTGALVSGVVQDLWRDTPLCGFQLPFASALEQRLSV
jgi:hypothetical protein